MHAELMVVATTLALYAAVVVFPGPNFALISRLSVSGARTTAIGAMFGLAVAATLYAVLTMTGLALVLTRIGWLARLVQVAGGCYLFYLGIRAWMTPKPAVDADEAGATPISALRGFRMGLIVNLSNPKGITFFISLYAVAIPPTLALWAKLVILAGGFALEIAWYGLAIMLLSTGPVRDVYGRFGPWIERALGALLAAFGLRLITQKL